MATSPPPYRIPSHQMRPNIQNEKINYTPDHANPIKSDTKYNPKYTQINKTTKKEDDESERKLLKAKFEEALNKYNRRFERLEKCLDLKILFILIILVIISPSILGILVLILFIIQFISIYLAKKEYNSCVVNLKKYGYNYDEMEHTTSKVIKIISENIQNFSFKNTFKKKETSDEKNEESLEEPESNTFLERKICPSCNKELLSNKTKKCPYCNHIFEEEN